MSFLESARTQYDRLIAPASAGERRYRAHAWDEFTRMGLPDRKTETWKYSTLGGVVQREWAFANSASPLSAAVVATVEKWRDRFDVAVVTDGVFRPEASALPSGYLLAPLDMSVARDMNVEDGWAAISAAVARPGLSIHVPAGHVAQRPLLLVHDHSAVGGSWASTVHQISLAERAQLQIAEIHIGIGENLRSELTNVTLAEGAVLDWVRVQSEDGKARHFSRTEVDVQGGANLFFTQLHCGSQWSRASMRANLSAAGAEAHCYGLIFGGGTQHLDQRVELRHMAANTSSAQLFKSVLKDRARGVLNGKIFIARDAQKVNSSQYNHALLLGTGAEADTKPELEIYADDVKANHGASIGRLDEDKIFYLMSRAIPRAKAQQMLSQAFVSDVLMKIPSVRLREFASSQVRALLPIFLGVEV